MAPDRQHPPPKKSHRRGKKGHQSSPRVPKQARERVRSPSLAEFLREAEHLRDTALEVLKREGHHTSLAFGWTPDGRVELIGFALRPDGPSLGTVLRAIVKSRRLQCFVSIAEAWMTRGPAASLDVMPSQSPEREQVFVISAIHPQQKTMWVYPFASEGGTVVIGRVLDSAALGVTLGGRIPEALEEGGR